MWRARGLTAARVLAVEADAREESSRPPTCLFERIPSIYDLHRPKLEELYEGIVGIDHEQRMLNARLRSYSDRDAAALAAPEPKRSAAEKTEAAATDSQVAEVVFTHTANGLPPVSDATLLSGSTPTARRAGKAFLKRHSTHTRTVQGLLRVQSAPILEGSGKVEQERFNTALNELRRNKLFVAEKIAIPQAVLTSPKAKRKEEKKAWSLDTSIFAPRATWCDSKSFYDTEECERRKLSVVWQRAHDLGAGKFIMKNDDDATEDDDGDGVPDEVEDVEGVFWDYHDAVFLLFDTYTAMGEDLTSMDFNQYADFVKDFGLASSKLKHGKTADLDRIFIAVDAASKLVIKAGLTSSRDGPSSPPKSPLKSPGAQEDTGVTEKDKSLSIAEFLHALVRIAVARYMHSGSEKDLSSALQRMFEQDILPRLTLAGDSNVYRERYLYLEEVDAVLRRHERTLRALFNTIAKPITRGPKTLRRAVGPLVFYETWEHLLRALGFIAADVTERDAALCFVGARMCVANPYTLRGELMSSGLPFEGMCEALVRLAQLKALPTDAEIHERGFRDAGEMLLYMQTKEQTAYKELLLTRGTPWGAEPRQPVCRCVDHLICAATRLIEASTIGADDVKLSMREMAEWWKAEGPDKYR